MVKKKKETKLPTASQLEPLLQVQDKYNRVGVETPFGAQNYRTNPDGTRTLVTTLGPQGQQLVDRSMGLAMTDSQQMQVPQQMNDIAGALAGRVGNRFGMQTGGPMQLSGGQAQKPPQGQQPPPMNQTYNGNAQRPGGP
jgi:hypothetical protein